MKREERRSQRTSVLGGHGGNTEAEAGAVLDDFVGARVQQGLLELGGDLVAVVGVDETKRKERTSLGVRRRRRRLIIINTIEEFE